MLTLTSFSLYNTCFQTRAYSEVLRIRALIYFLRYSIQPIIRVDWTKSFSNMPKVGHLLGKSKILKVGKRSLDRILVGGMQFPNLFKNLCWNMIRLLLPFLKKCSESTWENHINENENLSHIPFFSFYCHQINNTSYSRCYEGETAKPNLYKKLYTPT